MIYIYTHTKQHICVYVICVCNPIYIIIINYSHTWLQIWRLTKMLLSCTVVGPAHFSCQLSWCMRFTLRKLAVEVHNDKKPTRKFVSSVPATVSMDRLASPHWVHKAQDELSSAKSSWSQSWLIGEKEHKFHQISSLSADQSEGWIFQPQVPMLLSTARRKPWQVSRAWGKARVKPFDLYINIL